MEIIAAAHRTHQNIANIEHCIKLNSKARIPLARIPLARIRAEISLLDFFDFGPGRNYAIVGVIFD